ncbi:hypothetical protein [Nostoc sp. 'Lobaria pulmonaria (5183) cyanobiont']|uniref:hypothetical protein n=1 Tax=Nostoc sp. 'Lobaria pulmonaria (5183) cyanobiont' TaxID=1618022 RepID=UPI000CF319E6|nr:hypothetical protein [Nostoc sp. 'Lobaria pulmonaria (5183) cyanobiont']AVH69453.1 hypothetical protein NLP_0569 [Nostoc sp. 'Lobaria pulmonaria (5183) cyanobiont']
MNYKLSRRKFGQLALGGTVLSGLSYLTKKALAETPTLNIVGIGSSPMVTTDQTVITEVNTTELVENTAPNSVSTDMKPVGLVLQSLITGKAQVLTDKSTPLLEPNEILSGFTSLSDGTLVVAITPVAISQREATPTRITFLGTPVKTLIVSGLKPNQQLGSLLGTNDGRLIGLVGKKNGTPPIRLVDINLQTGEISSISKIKFLDDERVSNLAECPDGILYTSIIGAYGDTTLVQLDSNQKKPIRLGQLKVNGQAWNNGLQSLVCSATGQLLAFGAMRYETPNAVYIVDKNSGNMTRLQNFDTTQITRARA